MHTLEGGGGGRGVEMASIDTMVQVEDLTNISLDSVTTISYIFGAGHRAPDITAGGEKIGLIYM